MKYIFWRAHATIFKAAHHQHTAIQALLLLIHVHGMSTEDS